MSYLAIYANPIFERVFWRSVDSNGGLNARVPLILRRYELYLLNYLESRIDLDFLQRLEKQLNRLKPLFARKSSWHSGELDLNPESREKRKESPNNAVSDALIRSARKDTGEFPKISIVTANYNQGKFLRRCIESVLRQGYPNLEYIIIDGGSSDNSVQVIKEFEGRITYWISEKDSGQADAINKGLQHVTGEVFNWLNADDYLEPNALLKCAEVYLRNPGAVGWVGGCRRIDEMNNVLTVIYPNGLDRENIGENWNGRQFYQPSCFLSAKFVKAIGGLDPDLHFALDLDLWLRLLDKGRFVIGTGVWSNAVIHNEAKTQKSKKEMSRETIELQIKYGFTPLTSTSTTKKLNFRKQQIQRVNNSTRVYHESLPRNSTITFISNILPRRYNDPWRSRLMTILRNLVNKNWKVNYLYYGTQTWRAEEPHTFNGRINFCPIVPSREAVEHILSESSSEYTWITTSTGAKYIEFITQAANVISRANNSNIVLDYCVPCYENYFTYGHKERPLDDILNESQYQTKIAELSHYARKIIIPNPITQRGIHIDSKPANKLLLIPNIFFTGGCLPPLRKRKNICLMMGLKSKDNFNKINDFIKEVMSLVRIRHPQTELHCLIQGRREDYHKLQTQNLKTVNYEANVGWPLKNYRLCIFPGSSGSEWNSFIGMAAGAGLPIVTGSESAEVYSLKEGHDCFVADDSREFAEKCCQVLEDWITWHNFSFNLQLMVAEKFSESSVVRELSRLFSTEKTTMTLGAV